MDDTPTTRPGSLITGRRRIFQWLAGAATGGVAGGALSAPTTLPSSPVMGAADGIWWIHGHALCVETPATMDRDLTKGPVRCLQGASFSRNRLLFALPTFTTLGTQIRISSLLVRYRTMAGAKIIGARLYDGEEAVAQLDTPALQSPNWEEARLTFPSPPTVTRGATVSLDVTFQATEREIHLAALGCEIETDSRGI